MTSWRDRSRALGAARVVWGAVLLFSPQPVLRAASGVPATPDRMLVTRVLGARQVVQGAATAAWPGRRTLRRGGEVDVLHAASMLALAAVSRRQRRLAVFEAVEALGWAATGFTGSETSPG